MSIIRPAKREEAELVSDLMLRSKQYWGYSDEFMAAARPDMIISPETIAANPAFVVEDQHKIAGFYSLLEEEKDVVLLDNLFVEPGAIGHGYGKQLWEHAVETSRKAGYRKMLIESDPNAEAFYKKMGAVRIGEIPASPAIAKIMPGRVLPLLEFVL